MQHTNVETDDQTVIWKNSPVDDFQRALASREDIDQAKGILIALYRVPGDTAWQILSSASQHWNIKLRLLAKGLVEIMTGATPQDDHAARLARQLLPPGWSSDRNEFTAADRRLLGDERDQLAARREVAARGRDRVADARDVAAEQAELAAGAAADRAAAQRDRRSAAIERELSAEDRVAAEAAERGN